ncbi:uncharacterized protein LOC113360962 [Papaver somniferum]|uniref:uncharacterized protein LOC113360962 n=1 Tax=Papaver somniferum TaxID=3469 RepID=UPI000E6FF256|nr:uncharacterized protein LOC113360962 [Papaver somniferum]XP_026460158.1 uncharacterized protein LOC113360962 [Papaver somniferum]
MPMSSQRETENYLIERELDGAKVREDCVVAVVSKGKVVEYPITLCQCILATTWLMIWISMVQRRQLYTTLPLIYCSANPEDVLIVEDENGNTVLSNLPKMVPLLLPHDVL